MTFVEAIGIGIGIGGVHAAGLFVVLFAARKNAQKQEGEASYMQTETLDLMRERNELDRRKVAALEAIQWQQSD
jgi:hypothetical protein